MEENLSLDSKIIELVQQFTNIWDKKHPSHKDALAVANSWKTISQIVGLPGNVFVTIEMTFLYVVLQFMIALGDGKTLDNDLLRNGEWKKMSHLGRPPTLCCGLYMGYAIF